MRPWSEARVQDYRHLPLRAHELLADVPIHDVWRVSLPNGGAGRTMQDVRAVFEHGLRSRPLGWPVRTLFGIRGALGRALRWDDRAGADDAWSFRSRLTTADRERSLVESGARDGPFAVLYVHPREAISEIRNATVHAFLVATLEKTLTGYEFLLAIHTRPVSRWTKPYLAVIDPFRRWIVYPALLRRFHEAWGDRFGGR